jgi:hypothetical protein
MAYVAQQLGYESSAVVACGDSSNDIHMLERVSVEGVGSPDVDGQRVHACGTCTTLCFTRVADACAALAMSDVSLGATCMQLLPPGHAHPPTQLVESIFNGLLVGLFCGTLQAQLGVLVANANLDATTWAAAYTQHHHQHQHQQQGKVLYRAGSTRAEGILEALAALGFMVPGGV